MRLLLKYLLLSGIAAHIIAITVYAHFQSTGMSLHRYVSKGVAYLDHDSSPTRHIARFTRLVMLDSGLLSDPIKTLPRDIPFELPPWQGLGASTLRKDTAPRYAADGQPVPSTDRLLWLLRNPPELRTVKVASVEALARAIDEATPGTQIELEPGHYRLGRTLNLSARGSAAAPIVLRGTDIGSTILELDDYSDLTVSGGYWTVSDLIVRGRCRNEYCPVMVRATAGADGLTLRNLFVTGIQHLVKPESARSIAIKGLIEGITMVDGQVDDDAVDWPKHAVRKISTTTRPGGAVILCAAENDEADCDTASIAEAVRKAPQDGLILIRSGIYKQAATISKPGLHILAEPGATFYGTATGMKGALVVEADVKIEGLTCSHIKVGDGNGCCVRQDKGDVTLVGVHFHHSQMGVLTGREGGTIRILDSYFHDSGYDESGNLGHNIYVNSGSLEFIRSWSLAARNGGHEIKSRAARTVIRDSLIASLNARDSRLIDIPNGGKFELTDSILSEGPRSENWDLIGYGLEGARFITTQRTNQLDIKRNTFYIDREQGGQLLNSQHHEQLYFRENIIVGDADVPEGNVRFRSRMDASVGDYPAFRALTP
jgi:hypothetical protein